MDAPPKLEFVFELRAEVGTPVVLGSRRIVPVGTGTFEGPSIQGKLQPGGADYQIIHADGFTEVDARYVLETDQGELIYVSNQGMRHGPADVIAKLNAGVAVDPSQIYFRTVPHFETAAPRLQWLTRSVFVCVGERYPAGVVIQFYRVL
jgi:hypothetical protein